MEIEVKEYQQNGMTIKEKKYQKDGMNVKEVWVDGVLKGTETSPIQVNTPTIAAQVSTADKINYIYLKTKGAI